MKRCSVLVQTLLLALLGACRPEEAPSPFPPEAEAESATPGELVSRTDELELGDGLQRVEYGTLTVPEDHATPGGKLIHLPLVRVVASSVAPQPPLFLLGGGPGLSNIRSQPPAWTLADRDVVMVGYRGVDGSVSLDCPAVGAALTAGQRPLAAASLARLGRVYHDEYQRLLAAGIDVDRYTMLDVIADVEVAREALGYEQIDLYSESYGTRVAYLYGLRHPERIRRSLMVGVNPPGHFVWEPEVVDHVIGTYAELRKQDEAASAQTRDLRRTIRVVMDGLPSTWMFVDIDPDKVRCMTFLMLYETRTAAQAFEAFDQAREQDYAGLLSMCLMFDRMIGGAVNWGDNMAKAMSADYDPDRDYLNEMMPPGALIGSPFSQILEGMRHGGWPMQPIPQEYRELRPSDVETLMVNGNLDVTTPARFAGDELLPVLSNGHLVVLSNMAHVNDVVSLQPEAFAHLANTFLLDGVVDQSQFAHQAVDFTPEESLSDAAHAIIRKLLFAGVALVGLMFLGRWLYVRSRAQSIQREAPSRRAAASELGS